MHMTDDEIRSSMRKAQNPAEQVKVLAELNACSETEVRSKLEQLGIAVPAKRPKVWKFDTDRARQLLAEGRTDLEAAEMLGISKQTFGGLAPGHEDPGESGTPPPGEGKAGRAEPGPGCAGLRGARHNDRCTHGADLHPAGQMAPGRGRVLQRAGHPAGGAGECLRGRRRAGALRADRVR